MTARAIKQMPRRRLEQILQRRSERMLYYEDIKVGAREVVRPRLYTYAKS